MGFLIINLVILKENTELYQYSIKKKKQERAKRLEIYMKLNDIK